MTDVWRAAAKVPEPVLPVVEEVEAALDAAGVHVDAATVEQALESELSGAGVHVDLATVQQALSRAGVHLDAATAGMLLGRLEAAVSGGSHANGSVVGAGVPGDAVAPLEAALVAAAETVGSEPAGDPRASAALGVGWLMDEVVAGRPPGAFAAGGLDLPAAAGFKTQSAQLTTLLAAVKVTGVDPSAVCEPLDRGETAAEAAAWEIDLVTALYGASVTLARAYAAGRLLSRITAGGYTAARSPQSGASTVLEALDGLSTALPPHAARPVASSLQRWMALASAPASADSLLASQGELWRTVLTGEKKPTELLESENYIDGAERLAEKVRATALVALKRMWLLVLLIVGLFAGGAAVLVFLPHFAGTTVAGLSGILAAIGLTWKGLGGTVGTLLSKLEAPLWEAEVDGAVTDAITLVPPPHPSPSVHKVRSKTAGGDYAGRAKRARVAASVDAVPPQ